MEKPYQLSRVVKKGSAVRAIVKRAKGRGLTRIPVRRLSASSIREGFAEPAVPAASLCGDWLSPQPVMGCFWQTCFQVIDYKWI